MKKTQFWLVVFIIFIVFANLIVSYIQSNNSVYISSSNRDFGGPELNYDQDSSFLPYLTAHTDNEDRINVMFLDDAFIGISSPFSTIIPDDNGVFEHKVKEGENLSLIASRFNISIDTIRWANPEVKNIISPGQELKILPVPGILYETHEEDSLESVASKYNINTELIKQYNPNYREIFDSANKTVVLPYAEPINNKSNSGIDNLPSLGDYFSFPTDRNKAWNWGRIHSHNAVDIASSCGNPVYASANGIVEEAKQGWNSGYGNYILIKHQNGTKTKYAHNLKNYVSEGDIVLQGEEIALIGNTGNVHGPTGCHIHFEIYNAQNPFAVR